MQFEAFRSADAQAEALVRWVVDRLQAALAQQPQAVLVVPGGTTPRRFLEGLAREPLDWPRILVSLTDERCVPMASDSRNERMVCEALPQAQVQGLLDEAGEVLQPAAPVPDVVVLGMGEDGHVASLFPGSDELDRARAAAPDAVVPVADAPDGERRVSRSFSGLQGVLGTALLIRGERKRQVVLQPQASLPVTTCGSGLTIFWAP